MKHYLTNRLLNLTEEKMNEDVPAEDELFEDEEGNIVDADGNQVDENTLGNLYSDEPSENSVNNTTQKLRQKHLYSLACKLYDYGMFSENNLKELDTSNIRPQVIVRLNQLRDSMERFIEKNRIFITSTFPNETYEKNVYTYLVLRNELLALTKFLRQLLNLETMELDETNDKDENPIIEVN